MLQLLRLLKKRPALNAHKTSVYRIYLFMVYLKAFDEIIELRAFQFQVVSRGRVLPTGYIPIHCWILIHFLRISSDIS